MNDLAQFQRNVHLSATEKGWHENELVFPTSIALMHSELSEALEYHRHGNPPSNHIPEFTGIEEELADVIIRILDTAQECNYRVIDAMLAKHEFNKGRAYKHGGKGY